MVIEPEDINITAEVFLTKVLEVFGIENLAKEQDFDIDLRKKFSNPNQEIKNPDPENNETQSQTQNSKPNKKQENDELKLKLVRNSMLFVSVLLGEKQVYEFISKMSDAELKNFYEKNKTKINNMAEKIRDDGEVKKFLGQNIDVLDIIELDKSKLESLNNKLNKQNLKEWTIGLAGGGAVSISFGIAAVCTFFPALAIASGAIALPVLFLTCYKAIKYKTTQNKKSKVLSLLKPTQDKDFFDVINDIKSDGQEK